MVQPKDETAKPETTASAAPVIIKKYANRRLYNTQSSSYVTLEHLSEMVRQNVDFIVQDAKSGEDITHSVLTQIIFEQESRTGQNLLPVQFLRRLIRFYGDQLQGFLPAYLEMSMESFAKSQETLREQFTRTFGARTPMAAFEEQARQNMQLFEQAVRLWSPFAAGATQRAEPRPEEATGPVENEASITELRRQMEAMQRQLDQLTGGRKP